MPEWTFLTKHSLVLSLVAKNPNITARQLADTIGTTERSIRVILANLYAEGYISKKRVGRGLEYSINTDLSLRHAIHGEILVGDFLQSLGWRGESS